MSSPGSGSPKRSGRLGRLGRGRPKPAPAPAPPRTGWKPKGVPQSGGSGGVGGSGGGRPASDRRTPPSRGGGARTTARRTGQGANGRAQDGPDAKQGAKSSERRRLPRQLLPGGASRNDGADDGQNTGGPRPDVPAVRGGGWNPAGYTAVDYFMLIPGFAVAYYGGRLVQECAVEASGRAAFFLWLMIGFWITVATAKWPTFRVLRWSWVLAGVLGAVWTPG
ncbi:hypothetical protein [Yinghuangia sp. YIM S09857]|uniref:hypothetical protein n=1 Tax=Yinghuangia sp. YIM S09857 TaxID=3436929 RepID=UPI003F5395BD